MNDFYFIDMRKFMKITKIYYLKMNCLNRLVQLFNPGIGNFNLSNFMHKLSNVSKIFEENTINVSK